MCKIGLKTSMVKNKGKTKEKHLEGLVRILHDMGKNMNFSFPNVMYMFLQTLLSKWRRYGHA